MYKPIESHLKPSQMQTMFFYFLICCSICFPVSFKQFQPLRSNFHIREINSRLNYTFFGHSSEPCGSFRTILRHKLPIIHPDLPIPTRSPNSSSQPEFLTPKFRCKAEKTSRVLTADRTGGPSVNTGAT